MKIPFRELSNYDIGIIHILAMPISQAPKSVVSFKLGRNDHMLHYHVSGIRTYTFEDGSRVQLSPGDILLLPYKANYVSTIEGTKDAFGYNIRFSLIDSDGAQVSFSDAPHILTSDTSGTLFPYFQEVAELAKTTNNYIRMAANLAELLDRIVSACQSTADAGWLSKAMTYMSTNLQRPVALAELCAVCHMSERNFCRLFKEATGVSPIAWHRKLRIRKAEEFLASGLCTLESLAELLGFTDAAHLSRSFYRETGVHASAVMPRN